VENSRLVFGIIIGYIYLQQLEMNMHFEKTLDSKEIFNGRVFRVIEQTVELENNKKARREIIRHNGGAAIIAVDEGQNAYLVRQFRKPLDMETLEIPAGKLEIGEDPYLCAIRELKEETGLTAKKVETLGSIFPSPGYCDEKLTLYLATDLTYGPMHLDPDEFLSVEKYPLSECVLKIETGEIKDSKSVISILIAARRFGI
jgi:ADP-ribose pyrophosphatase